MLIFEAIPLRLMFSKGFFRFLLIAFSERVVNTGTYIVLKDFERQKSFHRNMIAQMNKM